MSAFEHPREQIDGAEKYEVSPEREKNFTSFEQLKDFLESLGSIPGKTEKEFKDQLSLIDAVSHGAGLALRSLTRTLHIRDIATRLFEEQSSEKKQH